MNSPDESYDQDAWTGGSYFELGGASTSYGGEEFSNTLEAVSQAETPDEELYRLDQYLTQEYNEGDADPVDYEDQRELLRNMDPSAMEDAREMLENYNESVGGHTTTHEMGGTPGTEDGDKEQDNGGNKQSEPKEQHPLIEKNDLPEKASLDNSNGTDDNADEDGFINNDDDIDIADNDDVYMAPKTTIIVPPLPDASGDDTDATQKTEPVDANQLLSDPEPLNLTDQSLPVNRTKPRLQQPSPNPAAPSQQRAPDNSNGTDAVDNGYSAAKIEIFNSYMNNLTLAQPSNIHGDIKKLREKAIDWAQQEHKVDLKTDPVDDSRLPIIFGESHNVQNNKISDMLTLCGLEFSFTYRPPLTGGRMRGGTENIRDVSRTHNHIMDTQTNQLHLEELGAGIFVKLGKNFGIFHTIYDNIYDIGSGNSNYKHLEEIWKTLKLYTPRSQSAFGSNHDAEGFKLGPGGHGGRTYLEELTKAMIPVIIDGGKIYAFDVLKPNISLNYNDIMNYTRGDVYSKEVREKLYTLCSDMTQKHRHRLKLAFNCTSTYDELELLDAALFDIEAANIEKIFRDKDYSNSVQKINVGKNINVELLKFSSMGQRYTGIVQNIRDGEKLLNQLKSLGGKYYEPEYISRKLLDDKLVLFFPRITNVKLLSGGDGHQDSRTQYVLEVMFDDDDGKTTGVPNKLLLSKTNQSRNMFGSTRDEIMVE